MSDQPDLPEPPHPPEFVRWLLWIVHHLRQEGHVIRQAPLAVLGFAALPAALLYFYLQSNFETDTRELRGRIGVLQATIQFQDERIRALRLDKASVTPPSAQAPPSAPPLTSQSARAIAAARLRTETPNDYVCVVRVPGTAGATDGILLEFGVRHSPTHGFAGYVALSGRYTSVGYWIGQPLRTDIQSSAGMYTNVMERKGKTSYTLRFETPNVTADHSLYMYFQSKHPLSIEQVLFLPNVDLLSDPSKEAESNKIAASFGPCPRK